MTLIAPTASLNDETSRHSARWTEAMAPPPDKGLDLADAHI
jgi:hypothetical protein